MKRKVLLGIIFMIIIISSIFYVIEVQKSNYVDKEKIIQKVLNLQKPNGGFAYDKSEDASLEATSFSVGVLYTLNAQNRLNKSLIIDFIKQCKGSDGGYKNKTYEESTSMDSTNAAIITLYLMGYESEIDKSEVINYVEKHDISFNKLSILGLIDKKRINKNEAINFVINNYEENSFNSTKDIDADKLTFYSLIWLHYFNSTDRVDKEVHTYLKDRLDNYLENRLDNRLDFTYYNVGSLKIIGKFNPEHKERAIEFLMKRTKDGIFIESGFKHYDGLIIQYYGSVIYMNIDNLPEHYLPWNYLYFR